MTKNEILYWAKRLAAPVLTMALGLILLFNPDSASGLIARFLGWILVLCAAGIVAWALLGPTVHRTPRLVCAGGALLVGIWVLCNPLVLAKFVGRVLGLVLMIQGSRDINLNLNYNGGRLVWNPGLILAGATVLIGLVLLLLPLTTSRILFSVIGIVMLCVGGAELFDRLRGHRQLEAGDPDIIDVEKL